MVQRLMFKGYFQETVQERWNTAYQIRFVNISFFLEDGTMKISEPVSKNSGINQGLTVHFFICISPTIINNLLFMCIISKKLLFLRNHI